MPPVYAGFITLENQLTHFYYRDSSTPSVVPWADYDYVGDVHDTGYTGGVGGDMMLIVGFRNLDEVGGFASSSTAPRVRAKPPAQVFTPYRMGILPITYSPSARSLGGSFLSFGRTPPEAKSAAVRGLRSTSQTSKQAGSPVRRKRTIGETCTFTPPLSPYPVSTPRITLTGSRRPSA